MIKLSELSYNYTLYKNEDKDKIWWVEPTEDIKTGLPLFTFDKKTAFSVLTDYPDNLSPEQRKLFEKENPFWVDYLKSST